MPQRVAVFRAANIHSERIVGSVDTFPAYGDHDPELVDTHPLQSHVPRTQKSPEAFGRAWETEALANGTYRLLPQEGDEGASLEIPRWCNERFCLLQSELVGWNETHLHVRHRPGLGDQVHVADLGTWLTVTQVNETSFQVDNNHPLAGEDLEVGIRVLEIRTPPPGQRRAPDFTLTTLNGTEVTLSDYQGEVLVLEFFASWCPSCRKNTEHLSRLQLTYQDQVNILAVDVDPWEGPEDLESFIEQNDVTWPIALDRGGEVSRAYGVGALSTEMIISPQGAIVHVETGVADHERVSRIVHDLLPPDHHGPGEDRDHP